MRIAPADGMTRMMIAVRRVAAAMVAGSEIQKVIPRHQSEAGRKGGAPPEAMMMIVADHEGAEITMAAIAADSPAPTIGIVTRMAAS